MTATSYAKQVSDVLKRVLPKPDCGEQGVEQVALRAEGPAENGNQHSRPPPDEGILSRVQNKDAIVSITRPPISTILPPAPENPVSSGGSNVGSAESNEANTTSPRPSHRGTRNPSPTPSCTSSSTLSATTTLATLSSRSSLSPCRSHVSALPSSRRGSCSGGRVRPSSRSFSRRSPVATSDGFLPPASRDLSGRRWRRNGRDHGCSREVDRRREYSRRWSSKDYASEASSPSGSSSSRGKSGSGYSSRGKRSRSSSRGRRTRSRADRGGVECSRCLERCRASRERRITRTLAMEYWVRTPMCKAAKSKHMEYMDKMTYSREQFIEETVFTCPMTGVQRETVLERNMFPYDVPTDVEHWTLWSRKDLTQTEMEEFVQKWAAENHPHVVEWECDNNEGDRSIDWYHVHVFFRVGCEDKTGVPRDPSSAYRGPCETPACTVSNKDSKQSGGDTSEVTMTDCENVVDG